MSSSSQAAVETNLIKQCCNTRRKELKISLQQKNNEFEKNFAKRVKDWDEGNWFYRLMFSKPKKGDRLSDMSSQMNIYHYEDALDRVDDLEALANKSIDGVIMLTTGDARFLHINEDEQNNS